MALKFSNKCFWAKKAAVLNLDTAKGQKAFYDMSKKSGLGERMLSYYLNAYEAAAHKRRRASDGKPHNVGAASRPRMLYTPNDKCQIPNVKLITNVK
ncbi:hypothetical protein ACFL0T_06210 [Candidatus Omnitrophota bacterium]